MWKHALAAVAVLIPVSLMLPGLTADSGQVNFINAQGEAVGSAVLTDTPHGLLIQANLFDMPAGWHAFHIHETGLCEGPDFKSAGGHFNPAKTEHGFENPKGSHAGDMPNVYIGNDGQAMVETIVPGVTLTSLLDADGSALVIHQGQDDYKSNPAGNAGGRYACGVVKPTLQPL